jgi:hypothetical protein
MPSRITKAIGYGMPYEAFLAALLLPWDHAEYIGDELDRLLDHTRHLVYRGTETIWRVLEGGVITGDRPVSELIKFVGDYDDVDHVVLFPTVKTMEDWFRYNDDIDYTFRIAALSEDELPPTGMVKYLDRGIHPFNDDRMDRNGVQIKCGRDDDLSDFYRDPDLVPGVPDALRWWLLECGVMNLTGVAQLRPMVAEWWG